MMVAITKLTLRKSRFKIAGSMAFQDAVRKHAQPIILLEPIMKVEVHDTGSHLSAMLSVI
jgi:translation elongation factor EF-G